MRHRLGLGDATQPEHDVGVRHFGRRPLLPDDVVRAVALEHVHPLLIVQQAYPEPLARRHREQAVAGALHRDEVHGLRFLPEPGPDPQCRRPKTASWVGVGVRECDVRWHARRGAAAGESRRANGLRSQGSLVAPGSMTTGSRSTSCDAREARRACHVLPRRLRRPRHPGRACHRTLRPSRSTPTQDVVLGRH